jgi:hypothetical protein
MFAIAIPPCILTLLTTATNFSGSVVAKGKTTPRTVPESLSGFKDEIKRYYRLFLHSHSLPLTPTHSHSLQLTPTHSYSLPLTPTHSHFHSTSTPLPHLETLGLRALFGYVQCGYGLGRLEPESYPLVTADSDE